MIEETRRAILAKAGLAAGAIGLAAAVKVPDAEATHDPNLDFDGYLNIRHFGAVPGSGGNEQAVSNRAAIQNCITTAANEGKVCYIPPGVWEVDVPLPTPPVYPQTALLVPSNSIIRGVGPASVIKYLSQNTWDPGDPNANPPRPPAHQPGRGPAIRGDGAVSNVLIEHIKVDRTLGTVPFNARNIYFQPGTDRIFVRHVECVGQENSSFGIQLFGPRCAIEGCYVHNVGKDGIVVAGCSDTLVRDNVVAQCGDDHITLTGGDRLTVVGNVVDAGTGTGADTHQMGSGIAFRTGRNTIVAGNVIRGGLRAAIEVENDNGPARDIEISGNVIVESGNTLEHVADPSIGGGSAILVRSFGGSAHPIDRINIVGNIISAPRYHGVWVHSDSGTQGTIRDINIAGNEVWINPAASYITGEGSGIACDAADNNVQGVRIEGNTVRDAIGPGIVATGQSGVGVLEDLDINNNSVADSGSEAAPKAGIALDTVKDVTISGNRAHGQQTGVALANPSGSVALTRNDLNENGQRLAYTAGSPGPDRLRIRDNPGLSPWTGRVTIGGAWSAANPYTKISPVTFDVPFPAGKAPRVHVRGEDVDAAGVAASVSPGGFTARLVASVNPGSGSHKAVWLAEPDDDASGD
jgi:parallel beta helix pectate lyase-like protein